VVDPTVWLVREVIHVRNEDGEEAVPELNELEVVEDQWIFANQYTENEVLQISISTGQVVRRWDLSALQWRQKEIVLDK